MKTLSRRSAPRIALALATCALLSFTVSGLRAEPPAGAKSGAQPSKPAAAQTDAQPKNPNAIPVPTGDVVNKQELEGGLLIEDLKIGDGAEVKPGAAVVAFYHGTLKADPSVVFDSAFDRGEPAPFSLNGVIPGWQKGVPGMKVGGIRRLTIPAALAYGSNPSPGSKITPNADLVFVIQVVNTITFTDTKEGTGPAAGENNAVFLPVTTHVIKDKDGKVLETVDATSPYVWLPGEMALPMRGAPDAIQTALAGMKVGGKRTIVIPKEFNQAPPQLALKRPTNVELYIEVELVALRNLPTH